MTNPDFRALCAELINHLQVRVSNEDRKIPTVGYYSQSQQLLDRARAALAQPEPVAPTDEELIRPIMWMLDDSIYDNDKGEIAQSLRELVARWGQP